MLQVAKNLMVIFVYMSYQSCGVGDINFIWSWVLVYKVNMKVEKRFGVGLCLYQAVG